MGIGVVLVWVGIDCFNHENSGDDDALGDEEDDDDEVTVVVAVEMGRDCSDGRIFGCACACDCGCVCGGG